MKTWFRNMGIIILLLLAARVGAQVPVLDSVCYGTVRNYRVTGEVGSAYNWILSPPTGAQITLPSGADTIQIPWTYPSGNYILKTIQHALNGCDADTVYGRVLIFKQPEVDAGPDEYACIGRTYKPIYADSSACISILWTTSGDGHWDDSTLLVPTYTPGPNDVLNGGVTLTLTGWGALGTENGCEPSVSSMELDLVYEMIPHFDTIGPLCQYSIPPALPDTSLEGITGDWSPPVINTSTLGTFGYLFVPDNPLQCGIETTVWITITTEINPTFGPLGPYCIYSTPPALPDSSLEGITGTWDPPVVITDVPGVFTYVFTPNDTTQCGLVDTNYIQIALPSQPLFDSIGPFCEGITPPPLPGTSLNGITGTWDPPVINTTVPGTFPYLFTPGPDECGLDTTIMITINSLVMPQFAIADTLCQYSQAPILPGTSLNGITGTWSPAWISTNNPGTTTYTFTPNDPTQCGLVYYLNITVLEEVVPQFDPIPPLCLNSVPPALPDTSLEGISGSWNPPLISTDVTGTFYFTFTPDNGYVCVMEVTLTIEVISDITPQFEPIGPLCMNSIPPALPDTSLEGITGSWQPAVINTGVAGSYNYLFTPDEGQCALPASIEIIIVTEIVPGFEPIGPLCQNSIPPALPDTSLEGITGTWDPPVINTAITGTFDYIFIPDDPSQCGVETTIVIIITTEILPLFDPIGPLCLNSIPPDLPDTSLQGIAGSWDPPVISTAAAGTFNYIFTPDETTQCGMETDMDIIVTSEIIPVFEVIGPLCQNTIPPVLPDTSLEGISGTWNPPAISTLVDGTFIFTFTPNDPSQCGVETTVEITVTPGVVPEFEQIEPLCQGSPGPALPGTSLNGVTGSWMPPIVNTSLAGISTHIFTPEAGQCSSSFTMEIEITARVVPLFDPIGPLSQNTTPPPLPAVSNNIPAITGTWSPPFIDTSIPGTFTYTFTPDADQCAMATDVEITVLFDYLQAITGPGDQCLGDAAVVPLQVDKFKSVAEFQLKLSFNTDKLYCEGYINIHPQLANHFSGWIDQVAGVITMQWQDAIPVTFGNIETVAELVFTPKEPGQGMLQWYTGATESYFADQDGLPIPAEFYTDPLTIYDPPEILVPDARMACEGEKVTIVGIAYSSYPIVSYEWIIPGGYVYDTNLYIESVSQADAGDYTLVVTDAMGCTSEKTIELVVNENPVATFHGTDTLVVPPGYILDAGPGLAHYKWNTGETTQSIEVVTDGSYRVNMETVAGCVGVDSVFVVISEEILSDCLFIPNAFTPNNDGLNDTFKPVSRCPSMAYYRMQIFNRWGEMLYESDDIGKGWDGRKNGTPCPGDVYVYRIVYRANGVITEVNEDTVVLGNVVIVK